jgi:hypothetical protein
MAEEKKQYNKNPLRKESGVKNTEREGKKGSKKRKGR